jgi:hypothetical protein
MHADDTVVDLAATPQPLPSSTHGMLAALGRSRLVNAADRFRVRVLAGHEPLALVAHSDLVPLD